MVMRGIATQTRTAARTQPQNTHRPPADTLATGFSTRPPQCPPEHLARHTIADTQERYHRTADRRGMPAAESRTRRHRCAVRPPAAGASRSGPSEHPRHPRALLWWLASMYLPRLGRWCRRGRRRRCSCGFHEHGQRLLGVVSSVDDLLDLGDTPPRRLRLVISRAERVPAPMLLLWPITVFSTQCRRRPSPRDAAPATIHCRRM